MSIELHNISCGYGDTQVLHNLTLAIADGERVAIMGSSGRGKTTLLRLLAGLKELDGGSIDGIPEHVAIMFQEHRLLPWYTVRNNLAVTTGAPPDEITRLLTALGMGDWQDSLPHELSGGMARRVALARTLLLQYDLLLLDEPFTGLDADSKAAAAAVILDELHGRTLITVLHDKQDTVLLGTRIVKLQ